MRNIILSNYKKFENRDYIEPEIVEDIGGINRGFKCKIFKNFFLITKKWLFVFLISLLIFSIFVIVLGLFLSSNLFGLILGIPLILIGFLVLVFSFYLIKLFKNFFY